MIVFLGLQVFSKIATFVVLKFFSYTLAQKILSTECLGMKTVFYFVQLTHESLFNQ